MTAYQYAFRTIWEVEADLPRVWELLSDYQYGQWWKGVSAYKVREGSPGNGIGSVYASIFRTKLPYRLIFLSELVHCEPMRALEFKAYGELEGRGAWKLTQHGTITRIEYRWQVNTNKSWMNRLAPLLRPLYRWNHRKVMDEGARGFAKKLGARLVSC
ncbi:SRPBCC family protein [Paenibacillus aurantius]|uniref:SRPBCC family protein n=1 Tax=Paenibacillus aurantius TaxID=2918900 RepID=A0AA96LB12_9BACL|nr:SRPBCC family protein [Paenibacillus aurantius]WNQ10327.1 SRPBCC family protein [Paenibacillus aurantius]